MRFMEVHRGVWRYAEVCRCMQRSLEGSAEVCEGMWRCIKVCRGVCRRGYHWLHLVIIDLVGDNREFEV